MATENETLLVEGDRITVIFDLPLTEAADLSGGTTVLRLYDPSLLLHQQNIAED